MTEEEEAKDEPRPEARPINIFFDVHTTSCDAAIGELEAIVNYADDYSFVPNPECEYVFPDGSTKTGCIVQHDFGTGGGHPVLLIVRDPASGQTVRREQTAFVYEPLLVTLEAAAPECGLELTYAASVNVGAEAHVFISPQDKIVIDDPLYHLDRERTIQVTEPGVYTVEFVAEDERTTGGICVGRVTKEVTVVACEDHDHTPTCGH